MAYRSEIKKSIEAVLNEHDIEDGGLAADLVDRLALDLAGEVQDDDGEEEEV